LREGSLPEEAAARRTLLHENRSMKEEIQARRTNEACRCHQSVISRSTSFLPSCTSTVQPLVFGSRYFFATLVACCLISFFIRAGSSCGCPPRIGPIERE